MKRKDECLACKSRKCSHRIVSKGLWYDEIACSLHVRDLYEHANNKAKKVETLSMETTGRVKRGERVNWLEEFEEKDHE